MIVDSIGHIDNAKLFYNEAFEFIKWSVGITVAVVAIAMPIVLQLLQNRNFNKNEKLLREEVEKLKKNLKEEINKENNEKIVEKTKELEDSIQKDLEYLQALIIIERHYSLSTLLITQNSYNYSLSFSIRAFLVSIDKGIYDRVDHILDDFDLYSEKDFKFDFKEIEKELDSSISEIYKKLKTLSQNDERKIGYVQRFMRKLNVLKINDK